MAFSLRRRGFAAPKETGDYRTQPERASEHDTEVPPERDDDPEREEDVDPIPIPSPS